MLEIAKLKSKASLFKRLFVTLFVCALASIFFYGNLLMVNRPRVKSESQGYIYEFFGKGGDVFISKFDYGVMIASAILLIFSMIAANWFAKIELRK